MMRMSLFHLRGFNLGIDICCIQVCRFRVHDISSVYRRNNRNYIRNVFIPFSPVLPETDPVSKTEYWDLFRLWTSANGIVVLQSRTRYSCAVVCISHRIVNGVDTNPISDSELAMQKTCCFFPQRVNRCPRFVFLLTDICAHLRTFPEGRIRSTYNAHEMPR